MPNQGFAGLLVINLQFPSARSLKDKRAHLRSIKAHMQRAGYSVSEVAHHDLWQRSQLAVSVVARGSNDVEHRLDEAARICERVGCEATTVQRSVLSLSEWE